MGHDTALLRGDQAARSFSILYLREGRLIALDCVNRTKDYVAGKALVSSGAQLDTSRAADGNIPLKETLAG